GQPLGDAPALGGDLALLALQGVVEALPQGPAAVAQHLADLSLGQRAAVVLDPGPTRGIGHVPAAVAPGAGAWRVAWLVGRQPGRRPADAIEAEPAADGRPRRRPGGRRAYRGPDGRTLP